MVLIKTIIILLAIPSSGKHSVCARNGKKAPSESHLELMDERVPSEDEPVGGEDPEPAEQRERDRRPEPVPGEEGQRGEPILES